MDIETQRREETAAAQKIIDGAKAAGRDLTEDENQRVTASIQKVRNLKAQQDRFAKGARMREQLNSLMPPGDGDAETKGRLSFAGLSDRLAKGMVDYGGGELGIKGLVPAGETTVAVPVINDTPFAVEEGERPPRLIDVLPVVSGRTATYDALVQEHVSQAGAAGVVAPGEAKPTRKLSIQRVSSRLRVVAVLSEPVDKYVLADAENLRTWVGAELADAIQVALEEEVLNGDGSGEHFTGLANTNGIQTVAFTSDRITTIAAGLSRLEQFGVPPMVIALSPGDALGLATTRNTSGAFDLGGAVDPAARQAWGTPYVVVPGLADGTGYVIGEGAASLSTDGQGIHAEWGTPGDTFTKNQLVARVEGRFNLDVFRPHAVVKMTLKSGSK